VVDGDAIGRLEGVARCLVRVTKQNVVKAIMIEGINRLERFTIEGIVRVAGENNS
jgi:choline kinase